MSQEMIATFLESVLLVGAGLGFVGIVAAGLYDLLAIARRPRLQEAVRTLRKPRQPFVTVLIYTHDDGALVADCLRAVRHSSYRQYDVVVVDNVSSDDTRRAVRAFMKKYPAFPMRLYAKRRPVSLETALRHGYQRSKKGEFVVTLAASSRPSRDLLKRAASRLMDGSTLDGVSMNERSVESPNLAAVLPRFTRSTWHIFAKSLSLVGLRRGGLALNGIYRSSVCAANRGKVGYEGSLLVPMVGQMSSRHATGSAGRDAVLPVSLGRLVIALVGLLLMTYAMVAAALLVSSAPLLISWLLVTVWSLATTWADESLGMVQKIEQTLCLPFVYFLAYASLVKFVVVTGAKSLASVAKLHRPHLPLYVRRRAIS